MYIFCHGFRDEEGGFVRLFTGDSQEDRYSKTLSNVVENLPVEDLVEVGGNAADIGTHSTRKGAASYVLSQLGGPNIISVFLRCCWSLGNVQDRYIFLDAGGDQYLGRSVGGLPTSDPKFATLPPHLNVEDAEAIRQMGWGNLLPGFSNYPLSFQSIIPYLFASIVFHIEFLEKEFAPEHPLFQTRIFTGGYVNHYRGRILLGIASCPQTGMVATGVPRDITVLHKLEQQEEKFAQLEKRLERVETILPEKVAQKVTEKLLNEFSIQGTVPLTASGVERIVQTACDAMQEKILSVLKENGPERSQEAECANSAQERVLNRSETYAAFYWCNPRDKKNAGQPARHPVPQGFKIPKLNACDCWMLWHFGKRISYDNAEYLIVPYSRIRSLDLDIQSEVTQLSKLRSVMDSVLEKALLNNYINSENGMKRLTEQEAHEVFQKAFSELLKEWYAGDSLSINNYMRGDQAIVTLYNLKKMHEKKGLQLI